VACVEDYVYDVYAMEDTNEPEVDEEDEDYPTWVLDLRDLQPKDIVLKESSVETICWLMLTHYKSSDQLHGKREIQHKECGWMSRVQILETEGYDWREPNDSDYDSEDSNGILSRLCV